MNELRATVVIDYQNVHLTGHEHFALTRHRPKHESLLDPLMFAKAVLRSRNAAQRAGHPHAVLHRVLAYRGQPSAEHDRSGYSRSLAQQAH